MAHKTLVAPKNSQLIFHSNKYISFIHLSRNDNEWSPN